MRPLPIPARHQKFSEAFAGKGFLGGATSSRQCSPMPRQNLPRNRRTLDQRERSFGRTDSGKRPGLRMEADVRVVEYVVLGLAVALVMWGLATVASAL